MANPPIVIGPFDNVPAPGSPIRSSWPQEISQYVADNVPAKVLLASNPGQSIAAGTLADVSFTSVAGDFGPGPVSFTFPVSGMFALSLRINGPAPALDTWADAVIIANGVTYTSYIPPGKGIAVTNVINNFGAGQSVKCQVYNPTGAAGFFFCALAITRVPAGAAT